MASRDQSIEPSRWHREIATRIIHPETFSVPFLPQMQTDGRERHQGIEKSLLE